jgi:hypothetical protein
MAKGNRKTKKTIKTNVAPRGFVMIPTKTLHKFTKLVAGINGLNLASYGV